MMRLAPRHQPNWDWRAAGNFICGGAGTGLIFFAAVAHEFGAAYRVPAAIGLALVALGLACVWAEIGRPFRAFNVFRHPGTSWMTREAIVAPFLFAGGLAAVWFGARPLVWLTALLALGFLYCQARMVQASKGIPVWRSPQVVPLIVLTGLAEGAGIAALVTAATADFAFLKGLETLLLVLVFARAVAWYAYRSGLQRNGAPTKGLAALAEIELPFSVLGNWIPVLLLIVGLAAAVGRFSAWAGAAAALAALGAGWLFKFVLITRAAYNQGFALPRLPVRGAGPPGPAARAGWNFKDSY